MLPQKDAAYHVGLLVAALVAGLNLIFQNGITFAWIVGASLLGVVAYSASYIYLLHSAVGLFGFEAEDNSEWRDPIEAVALSNHRVVVNGRIEHIPAAIQPAVEEIIRQRQTGQLQTISARTIHELGIADRFNGTAAEVMTWLIDKGVVEQKPQSAGEWVGEMHFYSPTPNGAT